VAVNLNNRERCALMVFLILRLYDRPVGIYCTKQMDRPRPFSSNNWYGKLIEWNLWKTVEIAEVMVFYWKKLNFSHKIEILAIRFTDFLYFIGVKRLIKLEFCLI
jgi:hypothetical protein